MKHRPECITCCLTRVHRAANLVTDDEWLHRKILSDSMQELCEVDDLLSPAEVAHLVFRRASKALGVATPYAADQKKWIDAVCGNEGSIREVVAESKDPFLAALQLAVAANLIDCEAPEQFHEGFSLKAILGIQKGLEGGAQMGIDKSEDLRQAVAEASQILFVHETAGELFFDRLLIETFGKEPSEVVSVLRSTPSLGSATEEHALAVGLDKVATLTDPGIDCRGILLDSSSEKFREEFNRADLVIAKGQAAFETLEEVSGGSSNDQKRCFYLLTVKCAVIAAELGVSAGDCVVEAN